MNCSTVRDRMDEFIDGRLSDSEELEFLKHIETCADCAEERERLVEVVTLVREIPQPTAPDGFAEGVIGRLAPVTAPRGRLLRWAAIPAGLAAACLLAVFVIGEWQAPEAGSGVLEVASDTRSARDADEAGPTGKSSSAAEPSPSAISGFMAEEGGGRAGTVSPGRREPAEPAAPPRSVAEGLASSAPSSDSADAGWGEDTALTYVVHGAHPDATAGVLIAELNHHRSRGAARDGSPFEEKEEADDLSGERLESDERGEPETMVLFLTPAELDYLLLLLRERRDAQVFARLAPQGAPPRRPASETSGDDSEPGRRRVLLRFER